MTLFERVNRIAVPIRTGGLLLTLKVSLHEGFWLKIARRGVRLGFLTEAAPHSNALWKMDSPEWSTCRPALRITFLGIVANRGDFGGV